MCDPNVNRLTDEQLADLLIEVEGQAADCAADDMVHWEVAFLRELQERRAADREPDAS